MSDLAETFTHARASIAALTSEAWADFFLPRLRSGPGGCLLWTMHVDELGYGRCTKIAGEVKVHRVSWALARGPVPKGLHICHKCDVRNCVNPEHLFPGTHLENMRDMVAKGRLRIPHYRGSMNGAARLDEDQVWAIKAMAHMGAFSQIDIARDYGVGAMTISRIVSGQTWGHVHLDQMKEASHA